MGGMVLGDISPHRLHSVANPRSGRDIVDLFFPEDEIKVHERIEKELNNFYKREEVEEKTHYSITDPRLDRQLRINDWDQEALEREIAIIGEDPIFTSLFILSASALGINNQVVISPSLDKDLTEIAKKINPKLNMKRLKGYYTNRDMKNFIKHSCAIVDLGEYGLADKLLLEHSYYEYIPLIFVKRTDEEIKVFTYETEREWEELNEIISEYPFPKKVKRDYISAIISSGIALEETKNALMEKPTSEEIIRYPYSKNNESLKDKNILIIGAGALGNFVGLGLGSEGANNVDIMDADFIEETNLNRQPFFYDSIDKNKAKTLAKRLNKLFGTSMRGIDKYFEEDTKIDKYDVIFDCVDNFETRILISEKLKKKRRSILRKNKVLISGGTSFDSGQVIIYETKKGGKTPADTLGLYEIVEKRKDENEKGSECSCIHQPDPSVIMSNEVIGGIMVDCLRKVLNKEKYSNVFYDSKTDERLKFYF